MGKYSEKLLKDFQAELKNRTDLPVSLFDAEESMDNLIDLYLCLVDVEKEHGLEIERLIKEREQDINSDNLQQNIIENEQNDVKNREKGNDTAKK